MWVTKTITYGKDVDQNMFRGLPLNLFDFHKPISDDAIECLWYPGDINSKSSLVVIDMLHSGQVF